MMPRLHDATNSMMTGGAGSHQGKLSSHCPLLVMAVILTVVIIPLVTFGAGWRCWCLSAGGVLVLAIADINSIGNQFDYRCHSTGDDSWRLSHLPHLAIYKQPPRLPICLMISIKNAPMQGR